jgi:hypothetical protein
MGLPADYVGSSTATADIEFAGTASLLEDYTHSAIVLPAYRNFADIPLTVLDDTLTENTETVVCTLVGASDANSLVYIGDTTQNVVSVDIVDDDTNLPLRLVSFAGSMSDNGIVTLRWATVEEENTSHFEILRSSDGRAFHQLGAVAASGSGDHDYIFTDTGSGLGKYYRLRMIDHDGSFTYSRIINITAPHEKPMTIFPNPANNLLTVDFSGWKILPRKATVVDIYGRLYKQIRVDGNRTLVPLDGYAPGVYFLSVENGDAIKFIVR